MFDRWHTSHRLHLVHGLLLLPDGVSWPVASVEQRSPFGPAPLQSLHPYYGPPSGPGSLFNRRPELPVYSHVDVNGTSQVSRRSILCLCPALRPRPNRRSLAYPTVSLMLPPHFPRRRLQRLMNFGALSRGFGTCCLGFKNGVATTHAKLASGWLARLYREGVEPSGSLQKVSDHPSSFSGLGLAQGKFHNIPL